MPIQPALLPARVLALEAAFAHIARTRMAGVPVLNARLRVQGVGFQLCAREPELACGILVTPWFMNLLRMPLSASAHGGLLLPGVKAERDCGAHRFEFIGSHEAAIGAFEAASLYSPMFEFADQAAAVATAHEVLKLLWPVAEIVPARRGFLFGRSAVAAA